MFLSETVETTKFFNLVPWVVFFPIIGLLVNIILGGKLGSKSPLGEKAIDDVARIASGLAFAISLLMAVALAGPTERVTIPLL